MLQTIRCAQTVEHNMFTVYANTELLPRHVFGQMFRSFSPEHRVVEHHDATKTECRVSEGAMRVDSDRGVRHSQNSNQVEIAVGACA